MHDQAATARLFFALWPDEALREALIQFAWPWRKSVKAHWVPPELYHITLAFLGEVPVAQTGRLMELAAPLPLPPCELVLQSIEYWPNPRVLCLAAAETPEPLERLVEAINGVAAQLGLPAERRPYRPHLTVARHARNGPTAETLAPLTWPVRDYCLVESRLTPTGPVYTVLRRFGG